MKNVSKETIIRTAVLFFTLVNMILTTMGKNPLPFSENEVYTVMTEITTVAATIWAWWKNNSFTANAIAADDYLKDLKDKNKASE